jgi:hypothetical protein
MRCEAKLRAAERALRRLAGQGQAGSVREWRFLTSRSRPEPEFVVLYEVVQPGRAGRFFAEEEKALAALPPGADIARGMVEYWLDDIRSTVPKPLPVPEDRPEGWLPAQLGEPGQEATAPGAGHGGGP